MNKVDMIVQADSIIPIEPHDVVLKDYSLVVDKGKIVTLILSEASPQTILHYS